MFSVNPSLIALDFGLKISIDNQVLGLSEFSVQVVFGQLEDLKIVLGVLGEFYEDLKVFA